MREGGLRDRPPVHHQGRKEGVRRQRLEEERAGTVGAPNLH